MKKLNLFKKKKDKKKEEEAQIENKIEKKGSMTKIAGYNYKITVKEQVGGTLRVVKKPFIASRWTDENDQLVYLLAEDKKTKTVIFWELFPQREEELAKLKPDQIEKRLDQKRKELLKIQEDATKTKINPKNVEYEIMKLKAQFNASKWDKCAFLEFDYDGQKTFTFRREGSNFFPIGYNADLDIYGIPSDIKKKNSSIALRNKDMKHTKVESIWKKAKTWGTLLIILMFIGSLFMLYKSYTLYEENPVNQCKKDILETAEQCGKMALDQGVQNRGLTKELQELAKTMQEENKKPTTVIDGIVPKTLK